MHHLLRQAGGLHHLGVAVQIAEQETFEFGGLHPHGRAESHQRWQLAHGIDTLRLCSVQRRTGGGDHVVHLLTQHAADGLVQQAAALLRLGQLGVLSEGLHTEMLEQRHLLHLLQRDEARAYAVVNVVGVVGNLVGQVTQLRLQAGLGVVEKTPPHATGLQRLQVFGVGARTVFQDAFTRLEAEVQAVVLRVTLFQRVHHTQTLQVVFEASKVGHTTVERVLPRMAKRCVAQVVRQRNGLDQVFVQLQRPRDGTAQLRHLQRMRQAGAEQVTFVVQKHLRFVHQPAERGGVHDAVAVALERRAGGCVHLGVTAAPALGRVAGRGRRGPFRHGFMHQISL